MRARIRHVLVLTAASLLFGLLTTGTAEGRSFEEIVEGSYTLAPDGEVSVRNVNGRLRVIAWDGAEVRLEATKRVRSLSRSRAQRALEEAEIRVDETGSELRIETRVSRRAAGLFSWLFGHDRVEVEYRLQVPRGADLYLETTNGAIEVEAVRGTTEVRTTNGRIVLTDLEGDTAARTVNGSVRARFVSLPADAEVELRTTNGGIAVSLPEDWSGRVDARTVNGQVQSDLPVEVESTSTRRTRLQGRLGHHDKGSGLLRARTTNGGIRLEG